MAARLPPRDEIAAYHLFDEPRLMGGLVERAIYTEDERRRIGDLASRLVRRRAPIATSTAASMPSCTSTR